MAYIIYCDESADKGEKFRDFFGGCIINSKDQYFNVGVSTGDRGYSNPHWESPYEHWLFRANKNA
jgi:hypothetical protein